MFKGAMPRIAAFCARAGRIAGTAEAQQQQAPARSELTLCNKTGQNIDIAVVYMDASNGRWTLSAWHKRTPGQCASFGSVRRGLFYYHAKNERAPSGRAPKTRTGAIACLQPRCAATWRALAVRAKPPARSADG